MGSLPMQPVTTCTSPKDPSGGILPANPSSASRLPWITYSLKADPRPMIRTKHGRISAHLPLWPSEAQENGTERSQGTRDRSLMRPQDLYGNAGHAATHRQCLSARHLQDQIGQEVWYTQSQCLTVWQEVDLMPGGESECIGMEQAASRLCGQQLVWSGHRLGRLGGRHLAL